MDNLLNWFAIIFASFVEIFVWSRFYKSKINYKNINIYISLFLLVIFGIFNYFYVTVFIRMLLISFLLVFCNWLIFIKKLNETIISTLLSQLLLIISELIVSIFLLFILGDNLTFIKDNVFGSFLGNILIYILLFIISNFSLLKKFYNILCSFTNNIPIKILFKFFTLIIISINVLIALIYYKINSFYIIIINIILLSVYLIIVYKMIKEKNNVSFVKAQNISLLESLNEYELMLDRQRIDNHENKNQLLIIKNMIKNKDKDVLNYIDTIIKDQKEDDELLYTNVKCIPSGGLQGIIYQKMLVMKDNFIVFNINVSRDVRKICLDNLSMNDTYNLCKIVGVLLDNAIEESLKIDDKLITISLYVDNNMLIIDISNKFKGKIDLDLIDNVGFTTKGNGHGYGLTLIKKIISQSDIFINERQINNDLFKQIIKVKIK